MRHLDDEEKELIKQIIEKSGLAIDSERKLRRTMESLSTPWYDSLLYRLATAGSIGVMLLSFGAAWKIDSWHARGNCCAHLVHVARI